MAFVIKKALIADPLDNSAVQLLQNAGISVDVKLNLKPDQLRETVPQYDALLVRSGVRVDASIIEAATNLKLICRAGVGVDNIDVPAATARRIPVVNSPGGNTLAAAELTCGLLMNMSRHIAQACAQLKSGTWDRKSWVGSELNGRTLAVVGLGRIGREVAYRMRAFGMRVIGYDPLVTPAQAAEFNVEGMTLDELWPQADYITLHVPLLPHTRNLLNTETFAKCKKGVRIVNCARGGIINEQDALVALENGQLGGLALDVFEQEPPTNQPLLAHPRVVVTPHLGASTSDAQVRVAVDVVEQLIALTNGKKVHGCCNPDALPANLA